MPRLKESGTPGRWCRRMAICHDKGMDSRPLWDAEFALGTGDERSATQVLLLAEQVADELRAQAEREAKESTERTAHLEAEVRHLHDLAAAERDEVARAVNQAREQLAGASEEAQQLISDAGDQAALLMQSAEAYREQVLREADHELAEHRQSATRSLADAHAEATQIRDEASDEASDLLSASRADAHQRDAQLEKELGERRRGVDEAAGSVVAEATEAAGRILTEAETGAEILLRVASADAATIHEEAVDVRAAAESQAQELLERTRLAADREMASAAEQTTWTKRTVDGLVIAAEHEAQRIRLTGHADAAEHMRRVRRRLHEIISILTDRLRQQILQADQAATELGEVAGQVLAEAEVESEQVRRAAEAEAKKLHSDAEARADQAGERAARRLAEAETGAKALRARVAEEVTRSQREGQDSLRHSRQEAVELVTEARQEADGLRTQARTMLADARREVTLLTRRRNDIAVELGQLSGVIDALAVSSDITPPDHDDPDQPNPEAAEHPSERSDAPNEKDMSR